MNCYAVLGISSDADEHTIRNAYRTLARRYHPDRGAGSSAEKFRQVTEAYETLIHPASRRAYDLSLRWTVPAERPLAEPSRPFREDPAVFGRFGDPRQAAPRITDEFDYLGEPLVLFIRKLVL